MEKKVAGAPIRMNRLVIFMPLCPIRYLEEALNFLRLIQPAASKRRFHLLVRTFDDDTTLTYANTLSGKTIYTVAGITLTVDGTLILKNCGVVQALMPK
jgi:hypothetical protein